MDQANNIRTCKKHTNSTLEFIQVKNVNQPTNKNLFYCSSCINQDLSFKGVEHILIHQIANEGDTHIIQKWPPIDNQQIIEQLTQINANAPSHSTAEHTITNFFSILKNEISNHIDTCQKKMVNLIKHQSFDGDSILKEYQSISKICELRKLLLSGNQSDLYAKEQSCREFILSVEEKNDENTKKLQDLLNKSQRKQSVLNFELPNQIKQSILTFIDSINFFNSDQNNSSSGNNQPNQRNEQNNIQDRIMKLISNKSNYCSEEFLKEIRVKLSQLNGLLSSLSFENQFKQDKKPIQFDELTNEQLNKLDEHVKHLSEIKKDERYLREVKDSKEVKSLRSVLNMKTNFIERKFINEFEEYLVETYPYLSGLGFDNMITEIDRFNKMLSVSEESINKMLIPSEQMNQQLIQIPPVQLNQEKIDLMPYLFLEKGNYKNGKQYLVINKQNNQIEVSNTFDGYCYNCISNITLEKDKKYLFRFQIQNLDYGFKSFMIGLMKSENIHNEYGWANNLSCSLKQENNYNAVQFYSNKGIYKKINRNELKMNIDNNEIELRVCLQEQLLEVLDYPNYTFKYGIEDQYKQNLINFKDLRLYISPQYQNSKIILKSAYIVQSW